MHQTTREITEFLRENRKAWSAYKCQQPYLLLTAQQPEPYHGQNNRNYYKHHNNHTTDTNHKPSHNSKQISQISKVSVDNRCCFVVDEGCITELQNCMLSEWDLSRQARDQEANASDARELESQLLLEAEAETLNTESRGGPLGHSFLSSEDVCLKLKHKLIFYILYTYTTMSYAIILSEKDGRWASFHISVVTYQSRWG